jgi:hypothetical protein
MRDIDAIEQYLCTLADSLRRAGRPTEPLVDEARAHLYEDAARIARADGCADGEAARRAVARFGGVDDVLRAVRRNAPLAVRVARGATVLLMVWLVVEAVDAIRFRDLWPPSTDWLNSFFVAELVLVSHGLWRALAGRATPGWLRPSLIAQGALGFALFAAHSTQAVHFAATWTNVNPFRAAVALLDPLWLLIFVQAAAGVLALRQQATQVGQPSLPVA